MKKTIFIILMLATLMLSGSYEVTAIDTIVGTEGYSDFKYEPVETDTLIKIPDYFINDTLWFDCTTTLTVGKYEIDISSDGDTLKINGEVYKEKPDEYSVKTYRLIVTVGQHADWVIPDKTVKMKLDICDEVFEETVYKRTEYEISRRGDYYGIRGCFYVKGIKQIVVAEKSVPIYPVNLEEK